MIKNLSVEGILFSGRAECQPDVDNVVAAINSQKPGVLKQVITVPYLENGEAARYPDVTVELHFNEPVSSEWLLELMDEVDDAHVIRESLKTCPVGDNDMIRDHDR